MNCLDALLNGTDEYKNVIADIRTHICQVFEENGLASPGGLIAINSNLEGGKKLCMKIFPLKVSTIKDNVPKDYLERCVSLLNKERAYSTYLHHKNIHDYNKLTSIQHFFLNINNNEAVFFSDENYSISSNISWESLIQKLSIDSGEQELNLLDLICFPPGTNRFLATPLPILTTPTVILIIENGIPRNQLSLILRSINYRTKESIHFFVYNRLIKNLTKLINSEEVIIKDEHELVQLFCSELNKVILPCGYSIDKKYTPYITDWPLKFEENSIDSDLLLSLNKFKVRFSMTSFHFPVDNYTTETKWIHNTTSYKTAKEQVKLMLENIYKLIFEQYKKIDETRSQARKSAFAAIMARNLSHNIGSHVLPGVSEMLGADNRNFFELVDELEIPRGAIKSSGGSEKNNLKDRQLDILSYLVEEFNIDQSLLKINKHIQERMEFIADVTMAQVFMHNTIPLEAVVNDFVENKEYLSHLSSRANIKIVFKSKLDNVENKDVYVDFPNDLMGVHAFYIILENIIRNTVKHSDMIMPEKEGALGKAMLTIQVREIDSNPDYYCIDIFDNLGEVNIESRSKDTNRLLHKIQEDMDADIIDPETNNIRSGGWGLLEIRFAATFLANKLNYKIHTHSQGDKSMVIVGYYDNEGVSSSDHFNMGYRFLLRKPRFAKCCLNDYEIFEKNQLDELANCGIQLQKYNERTSTEMLVSEHQFLIVPKGTHNSYLNQRLIISMDEEAFIQVLKNGTKQEIEFFVWKSWFQQNIAEEKHICIDELKSDISDNVVLYDSHGQYLKQNIDFDTQQIFYYEAYSSQSYTTKAIEGYVKDSVRHYELQEAIHTKIAIVDERIQNAMAEKDNNLSAYSKIQLLRWMGIEVPYKTKPGNGDFCMNLEAFVHNPTDLKLVLEDYIISLLKNDSTRFIVIHLTLFELICSCKSREGITAKLRELKSYIKNDMEKSIVLTSGRGTPSNLPSNCYFMHFSILQNYVIYNRSKFSLVKALYSVRKH